MSRSFWRHLFRNGNFFEVLTPAGPLRDHHGCKWRFRVSPARLREDLETQRLSGGKKSIAILPACFANRVQFPQDEIFDLNEGDSAAGV
jgi:hypothetical protein